MISFKLFLRFLIVTFVQEIQTNTLYAFSALKMLSIISANDICPHSILTISNMQWSKKVKLSVSDAMEVHRVVRRRGSHIF
jgi:hypothetical protein